MVYLLFTLAGSDSRLEEHSYRGRPDLTVRTPNYIYKFEFKFEGSVEKGMSQIEDLDYAGRFAASGKEIIRISANFTRDRGLAAWTIDR